jgi:SAM-dependent methyltransferase
MAGIVKNQAIGDEKNQKDYYDTASKKGTGHYDLVWGQDNIHLGYYPHLVGAIGGDMMVTLTNSQAADALTKRMIDVGRINHKSTVLDLGCGKGQALTLLCEATGAKGVGIDLSTTNIVRANELCKENPHLDMKYYEGSFTDLSSIYGQKFSVVFIQVAWCHCHNDLAQLVKEAMKVMAPNGCMVVNDYLGCDHPEGASEFTKEQCWKRLHFEYLHGHKAWRKIIEECGLEVIFYENLDTHMAQTYDDMQQTADRLKIKSADGAMLADNYGATAKCIRNGEIGMNLALLKLPNARAKL